MSIVFSFFTPRLQPAGDDHPLTPSRGGRPPPNPRQRGIASPRPLPRGTLGGKNHRGIVHGALCFPFPIGLEVEDVGVASREEAPHEKDRRKAADVIMVTGWTILVGVSAVTAWEGLGTAFRRPSAPAHEYRLDLQDQRGGALEPRNTDEHAFLARPQGVRRAMRLPPVQRT